MSDRTQIETYARFGLEVEGHSASIRDLVAIIIKNHLVGLTQKEVTDVIECLESQLMDRLVVT